MRCCSGLGIDSLADLPPLGDFVPSAVIVEATHSALHAVPVSVLAGLRHVERPRRGFAGIRDHRKRRDSRIGVQAPLGDIGNFRRSKCNHLGLGLYPVIFKNGESPGRQGVPELHPVIKGKVHALDLLPHLVSTPCDEDHILPPSKGNCPVYRLRPGKHLKDLALQAFGVAGRTRGDVTYTRDIWLLPVGSHFRGVISRRPSSTDL